MLTLIKRAILISDKIDFRAKIITKDKQGHFIIIIGSFPQEDIDVFFLT